MNDARRKELDKAFGLIEEAQALLEQVRDGEQEAFDNLSENFQNGEKGEAMSEKIDTITAKE